MPKYLSRALPPPHLEKPNVQNPLHPPQRAMPIWKQRILKRGFPYVLSSLKSRGYMIKDISYVQKTELIYMINI